MSIDAVTEELFNHIRKGARFNRVIANVNNLVAQARQQGSDLKVEFNFTKMRQNIHELPEVIKLAKSCGAHSVTTHKLAPADCGLIDGAYYEQLMRYIGEAKQLARDCGIVYEGQDDYQVAANPEKTNPDGGAASAGTPVSRYCEFSKGWLLLTCNARGEVTVPCKHLTGKIGNITRYPLDQLLVDDDFTALLDGFESPAAKTCGECIYYRATSAAPPVPEKTAQTVSARMTTLTATSGPTSTDAVETGQESPDQSVLAEIHLNHANDAYQRGDLHAACGFLRQALQNTPGSVPLQVCLGNLQFQLGGYHDAFESYQAACLLEPDSPDILNRLAAVALRCGRIETAEKTLAHVMKVEPGNAQAMQISADLKFNRQLYAEAARSYVELLKANPKSVDLLLRLGKCRYELGEADSARQLYEQVALLEPANEIARDALQFLAGKSRVVELKENLRHPAAIHPETQTVDRTENPSAADRAFVQEKLPKVEGWLHDGAALLTLFLLRTQDQAGIHGSAFEIGVFRGKYLSTLYQGTRATGDAVVGVDVFTWSTIEENQAAFKKVFGGHDRLTLIKSDSRALTAAQILTAGLGASPRWISVDGDHRGDAVFADLIFSGALLAERGVIAIDDFLNATAIGASEGGYRFLLGPGAITFKPFAFCQNKLFICRTQDHPFYLREVWRFVEENPDLPMVQQFNTALKNGRHWVEQDLLSTKCLTL